MIARRLDPRALCLSLVFAAVGCAAPDDNPDLAEAAPDCTPGEPDCDLLSAPCVHEEAEEGSQPMLGPQGLTDSLTAEGEYRVWPQGRVPYKIGASVGDTTKTRLLKAMAEWQTMSEQRVRFEQALATDTAYVLIKEGSTQVSPFVGYKPGKVVTMQLRNPEYLTVIRHEIGHVLGFHHEHKRTDRGGYIQVKTANIVNTDHCKYQFSECSYCTPVGDYNPKSVMHYRTHDLAKCRVNDLPVLLHKDGSKISHTWLITQGDLDAVAEMYGPAPAASADAGSTGGESGASGLGGAGGTVGGEAGGENGGMAGSSGDPEDELVDEGELAEPGSGEAAASGDSAGGCALAAASGSPASAAGAAALALAALAFLRRRGR